MLSTHRTALLWPSATWTHCRVEERLLLVDGTGLMTPLQHTTHTSACSGWRRSGEGLNHGPPGPVMHRMHSLGDGHEAADPK